MIAGIVRVGQADLAQAGGCGGARRVASASTFGKKPSTSSASAASRLSFGLDRAADRASCRGRGSRSGPTSAASSESSAPSRARHAWTSARCCSASSGLPESTRCAERGEREVHVVAAEQDVIADRDALEREVAAVVANLDQREVGRAAADVAHEHDVAGLQILAPRLAARREVRVERGLRLLEQRDLVEAGLARRDDRQLARDRIEARGHGDEHLLLVGRLVGIRVVPRRAQVREVARRRVDRRDALAALPSPRRARAARRETAAPARCDRSPGCTATTSPTRPADAAARRRDRARTCRPRSAAAPTTAAAAARGVTSCSLGSSRNDGSVGRSATSPGPTTCVIDCATAGASSLAAASAEFVVPRSMPRICHAESSTSAGAITVRSTPSASEGSLVSTARQP